MKSKIQTFLLVVLIFIIFQAQQDVTVAIRNSVSLFQNKIFPSLFPFLVLSPFFIHYGFFEFVKAFLSPITHKIFRISKNGAYLFFMSMISGFPSSALYAKDLHINGLLSRREAFHILLFSHFSNPIFVLSMVPTKPYLVLFAHYITNFLIGFLLRFHKLEENEKIKVEENTFSFFEMFTSSIRNAMQNALFILGVITFCFMLNAALDIPLARFLLEMSQGLNYLSTLTIQPKLAATFSAFLLSFGGFSVHIQIYGILADWKIPYLTFLIARIIHGILASIVVFLLF